MQLIDVNYIDALALYHLGILFSSQVTFHTFAAMAGIYIHIPFCKQACHYCDFHFSTSPQYKDELVQALVSEIKLQKSYLSGETVETIYFGGGTPSVLAADEIHLLINTITELHTVASDAEITLEANPDDLDVAKVKAFKQTDVNRFSIGIQSFFDEDLVWMNRAHRARESETAVKRVQDAGFENITADLIYGYPLLTDTKWKQNLDKIFELSIPHISAYSMTVEPQTALAAFISKKTQPPMNDQQSAAQFMVLMQAMADHGFEHYEISNFALPGKYSKHNSNYWQGVKYLGIGPSAHSYNGEVRQWNIANNAKYTKSIIGGKIPAETETLTENNRLNEYIMTSIRTMWGLDLNRLNAIAKGASDQLQIEAREFFDKEWITEKDRIIYLTATGKLYADNIAAGLFF